MALIQMKGVTKKYNRGATALRNITISVNQGEFVYLVGPSGAGSQPGLRCQGMRHQGYDPRVRFRA